mmetsp:Transcript_30465/g.68818  ORF Transcript_30465/g.68818 Transcript_30465/m.68818 type:complete len:257 (+) Transcript_30465:172-942(+)
MRGGWGSEARTSRRLEDLRDFGWRLLKNRRGLLPVDPQAGKEHDANENQESNEQDALCARRADQENPEGDDWAEEDEDPRPGDGNFVSSVQVGERISELDERRNLDHQHHRIQHHVDAQHDREAIEHDHDDCDEGRGCDGEDGGVGDRPSVGEELRKQRLLSHPAEQVRVLHHAVAEQPDGADALPQRQRRPERLPSHLRRDLDVVAVDVLVVVVVHPRERHDGEGVVEDHKKEDGGEGPGEGLGGVLNFSRAGSG